LKNRGAGGGGHGRGPRCPVAAATTGPVAAITIEEGGEKGRRQDGPRSTTRQDYTWHCEPTLAGEDTTPAAFTSIALFRCRPVDHRPADASGTTISRRGAGCLLGLGVVFVSCRLVRPLPSV